MQHRLRIEVPVKILVKLTLCARMCFYYHGIVDCIRQAALCKLDSVFEVAAKILPSCLQARIE